jgi:hypothetical protein
VARYANTNNATGATMRSAAATRRLTSPEER